MEGSNRERERERKRVGTEGKNKMQTRKADSCFRISTQTGFKPRPFLREASPVSCSVAGTVLLNDILGPSCILLMKIHILFKHLLVSTVLKFLDILISM
jgi:hypothetical protein